MAERFINTDQVIDEIVRQGVKKSSEVGHFFNFLANVTSSEKEAVLSIPLPKGRLWTRLKIVKARTLFESKNRFSFFKIHTHISVGSSFDGTIPDNMKGFPIWWCDPYMRG